MFATPFTDCPAIFVKSGPVVTVAVTAGPAGAWAAARCGSAGAAAAGSATDSLAMRMRPVTTMPAAKPATTRTHVRRIRRITKR